MYVILYQSYAQPFSIQIALALLNARISSKSFQYWSLPVFLPLVAFLLSKFALIVPLVCTLSMNQIFRPQDTATISVFQKICNRAIHRQFSCSCCELHHLSSTFLVTLNTVCCRLEIENKKLSKWESKFLC